MSPERTVTHFVITELLGLGFNGVSRRMVLSEKEQVVGRSERCDLVISLRSISRQHAAVWVLDGAPHVKDLGSQSGTFVNSNRVNGTAMLRQGDLLGFGSKLVFLVTQEEVPAELAGGTGARAAPMTGDALADLALSASASDVTCRKYVEALLRLTDKLGTLFSESQLLAAALDAVESALAAERLFALLGEDPTALTIVARKLCVPEPDPPRRWSMPSKEVLTRAMTSETPIITFDAQADERFRSRTSIAMSDVRSVMCVPLRLEKACLGAIYADNHMRTGLFSLDDGKFLQSIARVMAIELLRLRTHTNLQQVAQGTQDLTQELLTELREHTGRLEAVAEMLGPAPQGGAAGQQLRAECRRLRLLTERVERRQQHEPTAPGLGSERPTGT